MRPGRYEKSHISAFVAKGSSQACFYNRGVRFLDLVTGDWLIVTPTPFNRIGIDYGETPPFCNYFQRWIWEEQSSEVLMRSVLSLNHDIVESQANGTYASLLDPRPEYRLNESALAHRFSQWMIRLTYSAPQELELAEACLETSDKDGKRLLEREKAKQRANESLQARELDEYCRHVAKIEELGGLVTGKMRQFGYGARNTWLFK